MFCFDNHKLVSPLTKVRDLYHKFDFLNFLCIIQNPNNFFLFEYCSNLLDLRNLQEQVEKAFCFQKMFWPLSLFEYLTCSNDLKNIANSWPPASNFKSFSKSLEQFFLTVGQNNFGNKIPFLYLWWQACKGFLLLCLN